ncbi:phosphatidylinositol-3,5-bisphosphate 5-phosphatase [Cryptotrichosporon argae]
MPDDADGGHDDVRADDTRAGADHDDAGAPNSLSRFTLFETKSRYYVVASTADTHRVLKLDRTAPSALSVTEDATIYDTAQLDLLLRMVQDGNKAQGGLEKVLEFHGIVGFVKFTSVWYIILITKRSVVGLLGGHYIYHCDETSLLTIGNRAERSSAETKQMAIFNSVDMTKNFYFSYSYDITNTLQANLTVPHAERGWNTRFMWNYHLLEPAFELADPRNRSRWVLPMIHGFVDQAKISVFTRTVYITLIARRSRHYAGARFLTRGANEDGHVANEVETEQIVSEPLATSFGLRNASASVSDFGPGYGGYTSFVQYRGSIPVMWHQEANQMTPKPPIEITIKDPFYTPAAKHFDDLLGRYGAPIFILNLIKAKESVPRESKLLSEYGDCVAYLNQFLPPDKKMRYIAWDMAQAAKNRHQDVMGLLEDVAEESLQSTNFFHGGPARHESAAGTHRSGAQLQSGVLRVNCVDCLDRTNAAQFAIAKRAFGHQLFALGLVGSPYLPFACDAVDVLTEMYHDHGDTLAWQYTGSALVNRVDTYRRTKAAQWSSHSRDLLENIRRFYNNSMLDADKQAAINLFLGVEPAPPAAAAKRTQTRPHYRQWFTPAHLDPPTLGALAPSAPVYKEYYKPHILSQFARLYAFTMNSTARFATVRARLEAASPFESRLPLELASPTSAAPKQRRAARRWATPTASNAPDPSPAHSAHAAHAGAAPAPELTEVEAQCVALLDPPDMEQRIRDYDVYTHYHAADLAQPASACEPADLVLYTRAAQLAAGDAEVLLDDRAGTAAAEAFYANALKVDVDVGKQTVGFYEGWVKSEA